MFKWRRFRRSLSFKDRLTLFAKKVREKASQMPSGPEREDLLRKARLAETVSHLDEWANSPGLQAPK